MAGTLTISTLSDGTNSTSSTNCIQGSAKAWACFTGSTGAVLSSYNVSSITRSAVGLYVATFTNAMTDNNYATTGGATVAGSTNTATNPVSFGDKANSGWGPRSTTQLGIGTYSYSIPGWNDFSQVSFCVFR